MDPRQPHSPRQIITLLARIQPGGKGYPYKLLAARRSMFLEQAAGLKVGPQGISIKTLRRLRSATRNTIQVAMQWGLAALAVILFIVSGIVARNALVNYSTPEPGEAASSEMISLSQESASSQVAATPTSLTPSTIPTVTPTATSTRKTPTRTANRTPTQTPSPTAAQVVVGTQPTDSGHHYGQTMTPPSKPTKTVKP